MKKLWEVVSFIAVVNPRLGAGFYSHRWGPLPFAFGPVSLEVYDVRRVLAPTAPRMKP